MIPAIARLELHGALRARWFQAGLALALGLVGFFTVIASRESALIGFTGFGRVMTGTVQAALLFVPLLALFSTAQAVTGARQTGVLEWYLSYPNSRARCFWALLLPRVGAVLVPVVGAVLVLGAVALALGEAVPLGLLGTFLALLAGQTLCFTGLGMAVSVLARSPEQALLGAVVLWMGTAALVDFVVLGLLLRWELPPYAVFLLAGLNPVQAGRLGMLARVDPELGVLGPVGTWMTVTLGPVWTQVYGLLWPMVVGAVAVLVARRAFERRDVG